MKKNLKIIKYFFIIIEKNGLVNLKMLYYNIIPKECRSNTSLENYNKYIKENLSEKKSLHWINLLNFMKREEQRITDNIIQDEKSPINKNNMNGYCNIETNDLNNESLININNNIYNDNVINEYNNILSKKDAKLKWIEWKRNSCRYDTFITLYIIIFENYIKNTLSNCNILIYSLHKSSLDLIYNINSDSRFKFWQECDTNKIDRGEPNNSMHLKEGFISGLFIIFNHNNDFCITYNINKFCYKCQYNTHINNSFSPCLINITESLIDFKDINYIISYKYQNHLTTCEECVKINIKNHKNQYDNIIDKKTGKYVETLSLEFSNINYRYGL
jgi:hypothetical protein